MNRGVPPDDATIVYYDAEYPSLEDGDVRADDVARLARQSVLGDIAFYKEAAVRAAPPGSGRVVADVGCGTGRLALPLARLGLEVFAVDVSPAMLDRLRAKLAAEPEAVRARVRVVCQDAASLDLPRRDIAFAALPFNVLMLIAGLDDQRRTLAALARHMAPGGVLALDLMNPLILPLDAQPTPAVSQPCRDPRSGNSYVRHSMHGRLDADQRQRVYGVYEEMTADGGVRITDYAFHWRMVFRWEAELMLNEAGFTVDRVAGDFEDTDWDVDSRRIVVTARRRPDGGDAADRPAGQPNQPSTRSK
ncbi:class I SAM-dependent methyltransferase [Azospirillum halopraeferens]|uniref:class I SAM-dependent methyltransferase n=1 Tax=Azospirillum halopraeferens TaxID=34010 RepID=UPI00040A1E8E|nr:class I SAM-dependent methyltransferase [Azospirillum halopraeferens]